MACSGFVMLRNTQLTRELIDRWLYAMVNYPGKTNNQSSFSHFVHGMYYSYPLGVVYLPFDLFPNGALFFDSEWRSKQTRAPVIMHNNFIVGHDVKKARFEQHGLWNPVV